MFRIHSYNEDMILGIDEVGRGPWAGPLVVGAVILPELDNKDDQLSGLTDSKKLSASKRSELDEIIRQKATGWGLGWVHADEIDRIGLSEALRVATIRAVQDVHAPYYEIIIDGTINFLKETSKGAYVTTMAKADFLVPAVSAASIIAKVARDTYMQKQSELYPEYGFETHVGYGTAKHSAALAEHGVTPLHRKSFAPIAKLLNQTVVQMPEAPKTVSTKNLGDKAEDLTVEYLKAEGHSIENRNWKTRRCEIDIVSESNTTRYFTEVKYRSSKEHGGGVSAITPKKLDQMHYAASVYSQQFPTNKDSLLVVADVTKQGEVSVLELS